MIFTIKSPHWLRLGALALLTACGGGSSEAPAPPVPPPPPPPVGQAFTASAASPMDPTCTGGTASSGTLYIDAEVEPILAVHPQDANHLVAAWQQDRWRDGGARGVTAATQRHAFTLAAPLDEAAEVRLHAATHAAIVRTMERRLPGWARRVGVVRQR